MTYNREKALAYAEKWATTRNHAYMNFDGIGGDCTNFVSQCLYAGCGVMNHTRDVGWYYNSPTDRAAAWTGVEYIHKFLTTNNGRGPYGTELPLEYTQMGDIIQLNYTGEIFGHSLFVVATEPEILVAQHSGGQNYFGKAFSDYYYHRARLVHIEGARG